MLALPHNAKFSLFLTLFPVYHFMVRYTADSVTAAVWGGGGGGSKSLWPPLYREHWPDGPRGPARYTSAEPEVRYSKPEVRSTYHIKIKSIIYKKILLFLNHQRGKVLRLNRWQFPSQPGPLKYPASALTSELNKSESVNAIIFKYTMIHELFVCWQYSKSQTKQAASEEQGREGEVRQESACLQ